MRQRSFYDCEKSAIFSAEAVPVIPVAEQLSLFPPGRFAALIALSSTAASGASAVAEQYLSLIHISFSPGGMKWSNGAVPSTFPKE